jgi:hypothetical protein
MSPHACAEDQLVEQPAIGLFAPLGWRTVSTMEETFGPGGTLGRLHSSFMGGEYRPNRKATESEIARININSTTSDVTSVYSKAGKSRIYYHVVDEYNGDTLSDKRTRSSKRPLKLAELLEFFLGAWRLDGFIEMNELDRKGAQDFTNPSSEIYPEFEDAIRTQIDSW